MRTSEASAWPGTGLVQTGLMYGHAGALFLTFGLRCWGKERERLKRDEGSSEPDEDVLSQKLSPYTQPHPPSLSLTPSWPLGSQFWSLCLFPPVALDQLSDFTICKKWLLFKVKFCLQKVHLKQVLPLCISLSVFLFLVSFIAQTSFSHSSVHLLSFRGTFCGFLPPLLL